MERKRKGEWEHIQGQFQTETAWGFCSICKNKSYLNVEPYYLSVDVVGLPKCPHCNSEMKLYFRNFEYWENK
jgi:hypothetical protein